MAVDYWSMHPGPMSGRDALSGVHMKPLDEVVNISHSRHLLSLQMYRLVTGRSFQEAYAASSDVQRQFAINLIDRFDKRGLLEWIKAQFREHDLYEIMPMRELRLFGRELGVQNYATLSRITLVCEIKRNEKSRIDSGINQEALAGNVAAIA